MKSSQIGPRTFASAEQYDVLFKDIIVNSELRNNAKTTTANGYIINFDIIHNQIFKAELIEVYVPSATDTAVNVKAVSNRLYFSYSYGEGSVVNGFIVVQAGTYLNPQSIAKELQRQFDIFFIESIPDNTSLYYGILVSYNLNLNRYMFTDREPYKTESITLYKLGESVPGIGVVNNSMEEVLKLYTSDPELLVSNPLSINNDNTVSGKVKPVVASPGDYGVYSNEGGTGVIPLENDSYFGNTILSNVVLTNCKIFLSLGGEYSTNPTVYFAKGDSNNNNLNDNNSTPSGKYIFCQVPTNSPVSSNGNRTLLAQPHFFSCSQYYNPVIVNKNSFRVNWYNEYGESLDNILEHCFTVRFYYYQKNNPVTDYSVRGIHSYGNIIN
jgi:hypothetical protein